MTTIATNQPPQLNLRQAEMKLSKRPGEYKMSLRTPYQHPDSIFAEDVFVEPIVKLERGGADPKRFELANEVAQVATQRLSLHFSAPKEEAKLILKIYVHDVSEGDREARVLASELGSGLVRLCLGWVFCLKDGTVVLDGGRMGDVHSHWCGVGDVLHLADSRRTLCALARQLCDRIQERLAVESGLTWFQKVLIERFFTNNTAIRGQIRTR